MAGSANFDPLAYRAFLQRKREEVERWPEWKKHAAEAIFAPKIPETEAPGTKSTPAPGSE